MSGYVIANIDVKNPEAYKEYVGKVVPTVQKFGGVYLAVSYTHLTLPTKASV